LEIAQRERREVSDKLCEEARLKTSVAEELELAKTKADRLNQQLEAVQAENDELFCAYAAMILKDSDLDVSEENLTTLIKAAGGSIESFFPALFAKMCQGKELDDFLKFGGGGGGAPAAGGGGGGGGGDAPAAEKKEEKKVEEEEEEEDMDFDLFG